MYIREYTDLPPQERRQLAYKRRYKAEHPAWDDSMVRLVAWTRAEARQGATLLDLGCGHGNFVVDELTSLWGERVGYDVDAEATSGNVSMTRVVHGRPGLLPFADASFDVVTTLWVLEHVEDPREFVREILRVLKPGGVWVFATPNAKSLIVKLRGLLHDGFAGWVVERLYGRKEKDAFPVFYRMNTVEALRAVSREAGLEVAHLQENADPSYTSFGEISYRTSSLLADAGWSAFLPHLVGMMKKIGTS